MSFYIVKNKVPAELILEDEALEGVKRIAKVVAQDIELACDAACTLRLTAETAKCERSILAATIGHSSIADKLREQGIIDTGVIEGRRECCIMALLEGSQVNAAAGANIVDQNGQTVLVLGSDKRGTIYGLFEISEACGVTSLVYMGDCLPPKQDNIMLTKTDKCENSNPVFYISKEPSVKYRGFFINDEWPAFGGWCNEQFGGFNATCYEKLFIFLLRMKGNFMWPAMWSSVFSEDGPGIANAELADCLGVIMGTSHHEPLCRAGEEWQHIYKQYGESNAWNFINNKDAISAFWKDGMLRNKNFENLVTIGMRGEADSKLLGEDATMADNIQVVKEAILAQHSILKECVSEDLGSIPRVLAIYKEVEDYYYGDETCEGLKDWDELKDVIFLLSDDNWANTRGLPKPEERKHPGGYGMYYHFDYHGGPISYEWQNTSRLTKIWEQLTQAYEYGVRAEWIVNVGDLKGNEYPLTYFMALAYDYDKWSAPNKIREFAQMWVKTHWHGEADEKLERDLLDYMEAATRFCALRKPESLHPGVYSPDNFAESERVITQVKEILALGESIRSRMNERGREAFDSILFMQIKGSLNILLMNLYAGINQSLAARRSLAANIYADRTEECIAEVEQLMEAYGKAFGGKWNHMLDSGFTGFRNWDDKDWGYPTVTRVVPIKKPKMMIGFDADKRFHLGAHWQDGARITNTQMLRPDTDCVRINLDSRGSVDFEWSVEELPKRFGAEPKQGRVCVKDNPRAVIMIKCDKNIPGCETADINVKIKFADGTETMGKLAVTAAGAEYPCTQAEAEVPGKTFVMHDGIVAVKAENYAETGLLKDNTRYPNDEDNDAGNADSWRIIEYLGREGSAVKCFPTTKDYTKDSEAVPYIRYDFIADRAGEYNLELDVLARNPVVMGEDMMLKLALNEECEDGYDAYTCVNTVVPDYYASHTCPQWCAGVLDNVRRINTNIKVKEGFNKLYIFAGSPNISIDKLVISSKERPLPESYLGPRESFTLKTV